MKLKVCGMREPDNVRELVHQVNPDWMGLIFYPPSPRFVDDIYAGVLKDIAINKVGVFVDMDWRDIRDKVFTFSLNALQLHGDESAEQVKKIKEQIGLPIIKAISVNEQILWENLEPYLPTVDYFLFDTFTQAYGGSGKIFNWELLLDYPYQKPFLLSGGLSIAHGGLIQSFKQKIPQMIGVDINSKFELEPGLKDIEMIKVFKSNLKI
ncbi:phosphoribosylanthranilate isomerase [Shivajiella indica]|uniref:N-(5'-phosphoribosyl)anthranilate isomerase n=1 Tax=Shivajiella indica TaxID=872115 RepID=A0ABW5BD02_9BACT